MSWLTGTESEILRGMLYFQRLEIVRSITGLSTADAHWKPHPEANSLIEIVSHLAWVEWWWFECIVGGVQADWPGDDRGRGFDVDPGTTPEAVKAAYLASFSRSNEIWDATELDQTFDSDEGKVSLRWVVTHMIEETARHAGHADITRQLIDGTKAT
jgi:uncharacterized damage-inducible protein DinB